MIMNSERRFVIKLTNCDDPGFIGFLFRVGESIVFPQDGWVLASDQIEFDFASKG